MYIATADMGCAVYELERRHTQVHHCSADVQEPEVSLALLSTPTRNLCFMRVERLRCHILIVPFPQSQLRMMHSLRQAGGPPVVPTFLTEADSDDSDQNCGPEVVPVDTDDELDSVVDALQHDLEDNVPSPIADLNSSAPRERSPVGRESQVSPVVVRGIPVEVGVCWCVGVCVGVCVLVCVCVGVCVWVCVGVCVWGGRVGVGMKVVFDESGLGGWVGFG